MKKFFRDGKTLGLALLTVIIGGSFNALSDTMRLFIDLVIFLEGGEVCIGHFKFVDNVSMVGKFVDEVVFFNGHMFFWLVG
ncbi:MAG TPA: hypothetical protein DDW68_12275 [Verrucomicrobiales bacterium]|nr:hypothetical protein [Verrucomicrobiales bacterium]HBE97937.1 hypothetical protein [Verrucomicrobiales bacterium]